MRRLKNLNYIEIYLNEIKNISDRREHIELLNFDIANIQPSEDLYLLFLDLSGFLIKGNIVFDFTISIDMYSDIESDIRAENLIDLLEVERLIEDKFYDKESELRQMIENQLDLILEIEGRDIDLS